MGMAKITGQIVDRSEAGQPGEFADKTKMSFEDL
jgi:hypothetical protein